jgi:DNA-binding transcriptional ArsR family regulator
VLHRDGVPDRRAGRGLSRGSLAEQRLTDLEAVFAALAHEQRRHILLTLRFRGGAMTAGEIADRFACSWPTTTRHLRVLLDAGLVSVERRGRERVYTLDRRRLVTVAGEWLAWFTDEREALRGDDDAEEEERGGRPPRPPRAP